MASGEPLKWSDEDTATEFRNDSFIQMHGLGIENVLDFFATSGFYDKSCTNELLRMQRMSAGLSSLTGVEYAVEVGLCAAPHFLVISESERMSPTLVRPRAFYYVMFDRLYKATSLASVLRARIMTVEQCLLQAFSMLQRRMTYTATGEYESERARLLAEADAAATKLAASQTDAYEPVAVESATWDALTTKVTETLGRAKRGFDEADLYD